MPRYWSSRMLKLCAWVLGPDWQGTHSAFIPQLETDLVGIISISSPRLLPLKNGHDNSICLIRALWGLNEFILGNALRTWPACYIVGALWLLSLTVMPRTSPWNRSSKGSQCCLSAIYAYCQHAEPLLCARLHATGCVCITSFSCTTELRDPMYSIVIPALQIKTETRGIEQPDWNHTDSEWTRIQTRRTAWL